MRELPISEIFGPTLSGEAPHIGMNSVFVRFFGCMFRCEFCDTKYAIEGDDYKKVHINDIVNDILARRSKNIIFTGGEPLLYYKEIQEIMDVLAYNNPDYRFYFETTGYIFPKELEVDMCIDEFVLSPKLQFLNNKYYDSLTKWSTAKNIKKQVTIKFVYEGEQTIDQIFDLLGKVPAMRNRSSIYLMPENIAFDKEQYLKCSEVAFKYGFNVSIRLQNILWPKQRGV